MSKHILLEFPDEQISATAELLEEEAPKTCQAIWELLPLEGEVVHGWYSGPEIFLNLDPDIQLDVENATGRPLPGDVAYYYQEGGRYVNRPRAAAEICIFYDRGGRGSGAEGFPVRLSLFARIQGDWQKDWHSFGEACGRVRHEGVKRFRISRVG